MTDDNKTNPIEALIGNAADANDSGDAMRFSQAACNVANALCSQRHAADIVAPTESQIKHMVERFLRWRLPQDFNPDAGISFKPTYNDDPEVMKMLGLKEPSKHEPSGTNLFDYSQATQMVRYMLQGMPAA